MKFLGALAALVMCAAVSQAQTPIVGTVTALSASRNRLTVEFSESGKLLPQFYFLDTSNPALKLTLDGSPVAPAALIAASLSAPLSLTFTPDLPYGGTNSMAFTTLKAGAVAPVTQYTPGPQAVPVTQFLPASQTFAASACGSAATSAAGTCSSASASAGGCGQAQSGRRGLFGRFR